MGRPLTRQTLKIIGPTTVHSPNNMKYRQQRQRHHSETFYHPCDKHYDKTISHALLDNESFSQTVLIRGPQKAASQQRSLKKTEPRFCITLSISPSLNNLLVTPTTKISCAAISTSTSISHPGTISHVNTPRCILLRKGKHMESTSKIPCLFSTIISRGAVYLKLWRFQF